MAARIASNSGWLGSCSSAGHDSHHVQLSRACTRRDLPRRVRLRARRMRRERRRQTGRRARRRRGSDERPRGGDDRGDHHADSRRVHDAARGVRQGDPAGVQAAGGRSRPAPRSNSRSRTSAAAPRRARSSAASRPTSPRSRSSPTSRSCAKAGLITHDWKAGEHAGMVDALDRRDRGAQGQSEEHQGLGRPREAGRRGADARRAHQRRRDVERRCDLRRRAARPHQGAARTTRPPPPSCSVRCSRTSRSWTRARANRCSTSRAASATRSSPTRTRSWSAG